MKANETRRWIQWTGWMRWTAGLMACAALAHPAGAQTLEAGDEALAPLTPSIRFVGDERVDAGPAPIGFAHDSAEIPLEAHEALARLARRIALESLRGRRVRIEGHADASGDPEHNRALSHRRALAVANHLVRFHDVDPAWIELAGRGEAEPVPGHLPFDPANRRVQLEAVR